MIKVSGKMGNEKTPMRVEPGTVIFSNLYILIIIFFGKIQH